MNNSTAGSLLRWSSVSSAFKLVVLTAMLAGLPLLGAILAGLPLEGYRHFSGQDPQPGSHAPFSWGIFAWLVLLIVAVVSPFAIAFARYRAPAAVVQPPRTRFPWWGWLGMGSCVISWLLAWTRWEPFSPLQAWTFTPLWLSYILIASALTYRRRGSCFARDHLGYFLLLFSVSAVFWWFFEYLNRFVLNWSYSIPVCTTLWTCLLDVVLPFSTVLPAVVCTQEWLASFPRLSGSLADLVPLEAPAPRALGALGLILSGLGLGGLGVWPDYLFPLLWLAPLFILVSLQALLGEATPLSGLARGDWRLPGTFALAALQCGFFWEMWNFLSLAKWEYAIPFVDRFHVFEMPVVGYSGYFTFGLECAVVIQLVVGERIFRSFSPPLETDSSF